MSRVIVENIEDLNSSSSTVSVSNIDKCNTDNITGSVNVSNQISGYATEITTNSINTNIENTNTNLNTINDSIMEQMNY